LERLKLLKIGRRDAPLADRRQKNRSDLLLAEPGRTQADLHFNLLGFPVRVHPMFWLISILFGRPWDEGTKPLDLLTWVGVMFVSILIHELGHALAMRYFGYRARIVLYSFGGLAIPERGYSDSYGARAGSSHPDSVGWRQIMISLAGPGAGFVLAAAVIGVLYAANVKTPFYFGIEFGRGEYLFFRNANLSMLVFHLLRFNIFWGLMNLLPVYPLDGGQASRELFLIYGNRGNAIRHSLILSIATGVAIAFLTLAKSEGGLYIAFLFGYLAYMSYVALQAHTGGGRFGGGGRGW